MDNDSNEWPEWPLTPWDSAEVSDDDLSVVVRFAAEYAEGDVTPRLIATLSPESVTLSLQLVPAADVGGFFWTGTPGAVPNHSAQLVLPEPVAGRVLLDGWQAPPPPPRLLRSLAVGWELGPIANGRRLFIDSVDIYEDSALVKYRLRPGRPNRESDPFEWELTSWDLGVEDDRGTEYDALSGAFGGDEAEVQGDRDFQPPPPRDARTLTLMIYDRARSGLAAGRLTIDLRDRDPS